MDYVATTSDQPRTLVDPAAGAQYTRTSRRPDWYWRPLTHSHSSGRTIFHRYRRISRHVTYTRILSEPTATAQYEASCQKARRWLAATRAVVILLFMKGGVVAHVKEKKTAPARTTSSLRTDTSTFWASASLAEREAAPTAPIPPAGDGRWFQPVQYRRPVFLSEPALLTPAQPPSPKRLANHQ